MEPSIQIIIFFFMNEQGNAHCKWRVTVCWSLQQLTAAEKSLLTQAYSNSLRKLWILMKTVQQWINKLIDFCKNETKIEYNLLI